MKVDPVSILLKKDFDISAKFLFISGNEITLIQSIKRLIIEKYQEQSNASLEYIEDISGVYNGAGLFEDKKIFLVKSINGLNENSLSNFRKTSDLIVFIQENSPKIKKIKNIFVKDKDSCVVDCYELKKEDKIKIINGLLSSSDLKIEKNLYWFLVEKLSNKFGFLKDSLEKILQLNPKDINLTNIKKLLSIDEAGKDKLYFSILNKNSEIIRNYKEKILTSADVGEFYYFCKFFCQLIIESQNKDEYKNRIPAYLFKEKKFLIDIYECFNLHKRILLLNLLSSTEKALRKENGLSLIFGLRFLLSIKKIATS